MNNQDTIQKLLKRADELFSSDERQNNENYWNELSEFMLNNQHSFNRSMAASQTDLSNFVPSNRGTKKTRRLYDSTALQAVQDLASSFQGTLTNPATVWSKLRYQNDTLNNDADAVKWLEDVNRLLHNEFNESNFDTEIAKGYQSLVALANMAIFHEQKEDPKTGEFKGYRFTALHLSQIAWAEDKDGIVDTVFRKFSMTAKQIVEKWGPNVSEAVQRAADKTPDKEFDLMHAVFPRDAKDVKVNELGLAKAKDRPIASIYFETNGGHILEEGGYYEMPIYISRWGLMPGERYGRGPSHLALPDTRTLNQLKMRGLEAIDLQVRPPIFANQRDVFGQLDMRPGGISIVKDHNGVREFTSQARSDILQFSVEELRNSIRGIFFLDKLLLPPRTETGEMTAYEVSQRTEQMQRVLGPVLSRLNSELLQPLVVRAFKILLRSGSLPEMPEILLETGVDVEIVFVNQLARSQQQQDISSIQQWMQAVGLIAQMRPEAVDNINVDGAIKHIAKILGVPEAAVENDKQMQQVREQRAQAQQQQAALESANIAADTAAKAGLNSNPNQ